MNNNDLNINEIIETLLTINHNTYANYALRSDLLYRKVIKEDYNTLILEAVKCGEDYAKKIIALAKSDNPVDIAKYLGINVVDGQTKPGARRLMFASFTTPNKIEIMINPISEASNLIKQNANLYSKVFTYVNIYNVLLAHEIFHFVENKYKKEIYTQTKKITLWKLLGYSHKSNIRVLSEIAAMSFAKVISKVDFEPYMLDVILFYSFDNVGANNLLKRIIEIKQELGENYDKTK